MNFSGRVAFVTGANRGIGRAIAENLVASGARVIGTATSTAGADVISAYLDGHGKGIKWDVNSFQEIDSFLQEINKEFGGIDILINNAGITRDNLLIRMKKYDWDAVINTNLTAIFKLVQVVVGGMIKKRYGRIINIGSVVGSMGNFGQTNYAAAKAGLIGFSKSLAKEVASRGITVNIVSPGFIETDMTNSLTEERRSEILKHIPVNRFGQTDEVANAVIFLASDQASYITGETLHVNGGMYMK